LGVRGVSHITFTPDGKRLITCGRGNGDDVGGAVLWNVADGKQILTYPTSDDFAKHAEVFNGGKEVCITSRFQMLQFFEVETGKKTKELDVQPQPKYPRHETLTISRDGKLLAFAQRKSELAVWNLIESRQIVRKAVKQGPIAKIQFSPDNRSIASTDSSKDGSVTLWATESLRPQHLLEHTEEAVTDIAYSNDGKFLAACDLQGTVWIWETAAYKNVVKLSTGAYDYLRAVAWSPSGKFLVVARGGGGLVVFDVGAKRVVTIVPTLRVYQRNGSIEGVAWSPTESLIAYINTYHVGLIPVGQK
jgi:WD40 repeat protein